MRSLRKKEKQASKGKKVKKYFMKIKLLYFRM